MELLIFAYILISLSLLGFISFYAFKNATDVTLASVIACLVFPFVLVFALVDQIMSYFKK